MTGLGALPPLAVRIGGESVSDADRAGLVEVRVHQRLSQPTQCELSFHEPAGGLGDSLLPSVGTALAVSVGTPEVALFEGSVSAVEVTCGPSGEHIVRLRGYDACEAMRHRHSLRAHVRASARSLAAELVEDLGLGVEAHAPMLEHERVIQGGQSDLELLTELCNAGGCFFTLQERTLHLVTLEGMGEARLLQLGTSLLECRFELNAAGACASVRAHGWSPRVAAVFTSQSGDARVGRRVDIDANGGATKRQRILAGASVENDAEVQALAQADVDRRVASEVTLEGVAEGDPALRPAVRIEVAGGPPSFAGRYVITSADHVVDRTRGFVTSIRTRPPERRPAATVPAGTLGVVTQVQDPDRLGRVKVALPAFGEVETGWLAVLTSVAGRGKGWIGVPDIGDRVLVLFVGGRIEGGVVLGGLYGQETPPDTGVVDGAVRRFTFMTPEGQRLVLDDEKGAVRLENGEGSALELAPDGCRLFSKRDLDIAAPGRRITIRGDRIDFESA